MRDLREPGRGKKDAQSCARLLIQTIAQDNADSAGNEAESGNPSSSRERICPLGIPVIVQKKSLRAAGEDENQKWKKEWLVNSGENE